MIIPEDVVAPSDLPAWRGVTVALPLLDAMVPALTAAGPVGGCAAARFGAIYIPNGAIMDQWTPTAAGAGFELTPILKPLEPFRSHRRGQHLARPGGADDDHARAAGWLTGVMAKPTEGEDVCRHDDRPDRGQSSGRTRRSHRSSSRSRTSPGSSGPATSVTAAPTRTRSPGECRRRRCRPRSTRASCSSACSAGRARGSVRPAPRRGPQHSRRNPGEGRRTDPRSRRARRARLKRLSRRHP